MAVIGELATLITARTAPFERGMKRVRGATDSFRSRLRGLTTGLTGLTAGLTGAATAGGLLANSLRLAANAEQAEVAFATLLGSAEEARSTLERLEDFAATTPFQFNELIDAGRKLAAFGTETEEIVPTLRRLGDIASGTGNSISEMAELFGKMRVQGRLFAEDINQLTGRGIPVIQALAQQLNVTDSEVKKLVSDGKVGFEELQQAFISLTGEGSQFGGMMEAQSQTAAGALSTLRDAFSAIQREMGETIIDVTNLTENMQSFTDVVQQSGDFIVGHFLKIRSAVSDALAAMAEGLAGFFEGIAELVNQVGEALGGITIAAEANTESLRNFAQTLRRQAASDLIIGENRLRGEQQAGGRPPLRGGPDPAATTGDLFESLFDDIGTAVEGSFSGATMFLDSLGESARNIAQSDLSRFFERQQQQEASQPIGGLGVARRGSAEAARILGQARGQSIEEKQLKVQEEQRDFLAQMTELFGEAPITIAELERITAT